MKQLSLADFIRDNIQRGMITDTEVIGNVTDKRVGDDGHCSGIRYEYVRELSENRIGDVVKVSEETYWSQVNPKSENGGQSPLLITTLYIHRLSYGR